MPGRLDALEQCLARRDQPPEVVSQQLGNGVLAEDSVAAALFGFLVGAPSFREVVLAAASLGGDVDTIASMAGGLAGALGGVESIPPAWIERLENHAKGRAYILALADRLHAVRTA